MLQTSKQKETNINLKKIIYTTEINKIKSFF